MKRKTSFNEQHRRNANLKKKNNNYYYYLFFIFFVLKCTCVLLALLVLLAAWMRAIYFSENECQMTYMRPGYSKIDLSDGDGFFEKGGGRKYDLIRYEEKDDISENGGGNKNATEVTKSVLALFIPGNGGDYAQVRSLAHSTHALGKYYSSSSSSSSEETKATTKIEWYAMDFKEEFSAFDADAMERQVESTRWVLEEDFGRKIFESDEDDDADDGGGKYLKNVIVVGHSMGGLVAKYAAEQVIVNNSNLNRRIEHVHVTTLATPHAYHPGAFALSSFANHAWRKRTSKKMTTSEGKKELMSVMSVSGGMRDWQVSGVDASLVLSLNDSNNNSGNNRNRNSERVKTVSTRTSCDHLAICWCKQVILSLAVALHRVAKAGGNEGVGDISQYIKNIHVDIPPHLGWHGFEDASSTLKKKDNHGVFIDGFFSGVDDINTDRNTRGWYTFAPILVARTPNVASAAISWHVLFSSGPSSSMAFSGLAFSSLYVLSALSENFAIGAKEMRALRLEMYVLFATSVVLVCGYGMAKILHLIFCKMLALSRKNTASTKLDFLRRMSVSTHVSISAALAAVAPALVHAYMIVFKCIFGTSTDENTLVHSCCASVWASFLLLPAFVTKVKDGNLPGGMWSAIDSGVALCTAVGTILVYHSNHAEEKKKKKKKSMTIIITSLLFCAVSSGAGMASLAHLGLLFFSFC
ncbi:unnamed protein product [Bathycoccus prasinos]